MKLSTARTKNAYSAIADPIMDLRVKVRCTMDADEIDELLYGLERSIWNKLVLAMNIKEG